MKALTTRLQEYAQVRVWDPPFLSPLVRFVSFFLLLALPLTLILTFQFLPSRYRLTPGEVSSQTIKSPERVTFVSQYLTRIAREQAAAQVPEVLSYDPVIANQQSSAATDVLRKVTDVINATTLSRTQKRDAINALLGTQVSAATVEYMAEMDRDSWQAVAIETMRLLDDQMRGRLSAEQIGDVKARLPERVDPRLTVAQAQVAVGLVGAYLRPNVSVDRVATEEKQRAARDTVRPARVTIEKGEVIVRDGEVVQEADLEKLEASGLLYAQVEWSDIAGVALLVASLSLMLAAYIHIFLPRLMVNDRRLLLLVVLVVGAALAAKLTLPGRQLYAYVFPLSAAPMLVATLLDGPLAVLVTALLSVVVSYIAGGQIDLTASYLVGGLAGVFGTWKADRLNRFFLAGIAVAVANYMVVGGFALLSGDFGVSRLALHGFLSAVHGGLAAALTVGTFAVLGHIFGITTSLHLLELAHPNQPLLRLLVTEAPGTYHHSIIVGNLAERAAEAIGADSLLVRVGSYYHDIGKSLRPGFFVDNQVDGQNVHDLLDPRTSARTIIAHVSDGLSLAHKYRLPARVSDFIAEHHGTRLATYFYHRAQQQGDTDPAGFSYPGPRPQSKETAIVMLADSVEACARSSKDHSPEKLDQIVEKLVSDRLSEGQLDESDLTLKDLAEIKKAFKTVLRGVFHPRVAYPEMRSDSMLASMGRRASTEQRALDER